MKLKTLYKKLTLANILNLAGIKLFGFSRRICGKLILWAIALDPSRAHFKKNLAYIGIAYDEPDNSPTSSASQSPDITPRKNVPYCSIPEGCKLLSKKITFFDVNQTIRLSLPKVINHDFIVAEEYKCEAPLPDTYLAELNNVTVFAGTDLILAEGIALYDEIERNSTEQYAIKSPVIEKVFPEMLTLKTRQAPRFYDRTIECGIHFAKDHSVNYFHWIVECLPRLSLISHLDKKIPLLVDGHLHSQAFEALALINAGERDIIKLQRNKSYLVQKLYYPSQLSVVHDNYNLPYYQKDAVYSPKAIHFVRNAVLEKLNLTAQKPRRKIFVSRKTSNYRQLLNSTKVENYLVAQGFEIVFPENLSFFAQVRLFSEAKIIIGQSGAGMTNFIFAPTECNVLMLYNDAPTNSLHLFGALATAININLEFLLGKTALPCPGIPLLHTDFHIDLNVLITFLEKSGWLNE